MYKFLIQSFWGRSLLGLLTLLIIWLSIALTVALIMNLGGEVVVAGILILFASAMVGEIFFRPPTPHDPNKSKNRFPGP